MPVKWTKRLRERAGLAAAAAFASLMLAGTGLPMRWSDSRALIGLGWPWLTRWSGRSDE